MARWSTSGVADEGANNLHLIEEAVAVHDLAEDDMLIVEPGLPHGANEELGVIGARLGIGGRLKVLADQLSSLDRLAAGVVVVDEVTALANEAWEGDTLKRSGLPLSFPNIASIASRRYSFLAAAAPLDPQDNSPLVLPIGSTSSCCCSTRFLAEAPLAVDK
jgi:hypothetical protein